MRQTIEGNKTCEACGHTERVTVSIMLQCDTCGKLSDYEAADGWVSCTVFPVDKDYPSHDWTHEADFCGYECYLKWLNGAAARNDIQFITPGHIFPKDVPNIIDGMRRYFATVQP